MSEIGKWQLVRKYEMYTEKVQSRNKFIDVISHSNKRLIYRNLDQKKTTAQIVHLWWEPHLSSTNITVVLLAKEEEGRQNT